MTLINTVSAGTTTYCNEILKNAPYKAITPENVTDAGLLIIFQPVVEAFAFDLAIENGICNGVTTVGSRDNASGIWNIAYTCNCDAITVLTDDVSITSDQVFVGLNGRATTAIPTVDSYIIGVVRSGIKTTTLCDGTVSNCFDVELSKQSIPFAGIVPPLKTNKKI
jgi:hypothetical protein